MKQPMKPRKRAAELELCSLTFRPEGAWVNCYVCMTSATHGERAQLIGTVPLTACEFDAQVFENFQALMQRVFDGTAVRMFGVKPGSVRYLRECSSFSVMKPGHA